MIGIMRYPLRTIAQAGSGKAFDHDANDRHANSDDVAWASFGSSSSSSSFWESPPSSSIYAPSAGRLTSSAGCGCPRVRSRPHARGWQASDTAPRGYIDSVLGGWAMPKAYSEDM